MSGPGSVPPGPARPGPGPAAPEPARRGPTGVDRAGVDRIGVDRIGVDPVGSLLGDREVALVDLLDRVLAGGVVLAGDVTISLAGVDLIRISLRALVTSIAPAGGRGPDGRG